MALVKETLQTSLYEGLYEIFSNQAKKATNGDEQEDPEVVIKKVANDMADVIAKAVDEYVKSGDIVVGPTNVAVSLGTLAGVVAPLEPAKIV